MCAGSELNATAAAPHDASVIVVIGELLLSVDERQPLV